MKANARVLAVLEAALEEDPSNHAVRLHLVRLLLEGGEVGRAIEHVSVAFSGEAVDEEASLEAVSAPGAGASGGTAADSLGAVGPGEEGVGSELLDDGGEGSADVEAEGEGEGERSDGSLPSGDETPLRLIQASHRFSEEPDEDEALGEEPRITLADVAGMKSVKRRLELSFLAPLRDPRMRKMYGKSLRGGLLLYGPPGCGKTFIARATAGELGARFFAVGIQDVLDMYLGESERKLHELFETARRQAPAVLFFDEIDALGHKRSQLRGHGGRNLVSALLAELDGVAARNRGIFVLGATNHPWDVDSALRRPGRFDRTVLVLPPDEEARAAILKLELASRPVKGVNLRRLAARTEEFSGADLVHLCDSAVEYAMEESLETGRMRALRSSDFERALRELRPSVRPWFATARNYALFANDGGTYDDLLRYIAERGL